MTDDTEIVGNNAKLEEIVKMSIDIQLLDLGSSRSMGKSGDISSFIRIIRSIKCLSFRICLELPNDFVSVLLIIFSNECFNTGRIKEGHIGFCRVNSLADGLGYINKVIEYEY